MRRRYLYLLFLTYICIVSGQHIKIQGSVYNIATDEPIPNVNIYLPDYTKGTISDNQGKFVLEISEQMVDRILIFEHIGFDTLILAVEDFPGNSVIYLKPNPLKSDAIDVEALRLDIEIVKDLPQALKVIKKDEFEIRGYTDAGDLLSKDQSIQINEETSGKKTLAMRAGNADDVLILLNGIKLNNAYDNTFDISFINLENVERIEIIKGSHTALYGPDGFSGVINIIPDWYKKYNIKFQQRFGTYNSAYWNLQLNYDFLNRAYISYNYKNGNSTRKYKDNSELNNSLNNKTDQHTLYAVYKINENEKESQNHIGISFLGTEHFFEDTRNNETISDLNQIYILNYDGSIFNLNEIKISASFQKYRTEQGLNSYYAYYNRDMSCKRYNLNNEKSFTYKSLDLYLSYQFESNLLNYTNNRQIDGEESVGLYKAEYQQNKHGIASIIKFHAPTSDDFFNAFDIDLSYRWDYVNNDKKNIVYNEDFPNGIYPEDHQWRESTLKFSTLLSGENKLYQFDSYINFGTNVKFPSLLQQFSTPQQIIENRATTYPNLNPEKNLALELAASVSRQFVSVKEIDNWQISINYFKNEYENKFRMYKLPYNPITFYDNIQTATLSGVDISTSSEFYKKRIKLEFGISRYHVSARSAFPFKYDLKYIFNLEYSFWGFILKTNLFKEGEQSGVIRSANGIFQEITLPAYSNIDIHLSRTVTYHRLSFFINTSVRNLMDSEAQIEGIAIRDRRYYLTFGFQY
jgi:hypothetical protein